MIRRFGIYPFLVTLVSLVVLITPGLPPSPVHAMHSDTLPPSFDGIPLRYQRVLHYEHPYPSQDGFYVQEIGDNDGPAVGAGLRIGHTITSVNGEPVETYGEIQAIVQDHLGETVTFTVLRKTPKFEKELRENPFYKPRGGALYEEMEVVVPYTVPQRRKLTVVQGTGNRYYHRLNLAHTPDTRTHTVFEYPAEARERGMKPCPICFTEEVSHLDKLLQREAHGGDLLAERLREEFGVDPDPPSFLNSLLDRLKPALVMENPAIHPVLLKTSRVYGFGLRDGTLLISQGLLDVLETDSERAAVIAHLLAHYDRRHHHSPVRSRQVRSLIERVLKQVTGIDFQFSQLREWSSALPGFSYYRELIEEGYSETQEREAMFLSMVYLYRSGYGYHGLETWVEKHRDMVDRVHPRWIDYLLVHPLPDTLNQDIPAWKKRIPLNFKRFTSTEGVPDSNR